ncbi:low temperature requirement protein A [Kribbella sp. C-35]|uniref:low temperature requirement protein A n=1 Tax=Kribbella sp. C-35 TaxID=2789276 RepID=UPI00397DE6C4
MAGVVVLALGLPDMFASLDHGGHIDVRVMVFGYVVMRLSMLFLWMLAGRNDPDRAPVTRGGFVLVTGVPLSPEQRAVLASRGTEVLEVAPGSALYKWLADGKAAAALVRPDFTVLRVARDVAALCEAAPNFVVA